MSEYSKRIEEVEVELKNNILVLARYDEVMTLKAPKFAIDELKREVELKLADFMQTATEAKKQVA